MRCIHIGLLCIQENVADRPNMASVVLMTNTNSIALIAPTQPASFMGNNVLSVTSLQQDIGSNITANKVSITEDTGVLPTHQPTNPSKPIQFNPTQHLKLVFLGWAGLS